MTCTFTEHEDGGLTISCTGRVPWCADCNARAAARQCDAPTPGGRTCDRLLCERCARSPKPGIDYCHEHAKAAHALWLDRQRRKG